MTARRDLSLAAVFSALWRERHVGHAAASIGVTQPAFSNALKRLRDIIGDVLFVRSGQGMQPTARAEALAPLFLDGLEKLEAALTPPAHFDPETSDRVFTLALPDYLEVVLLPLLITQAVAENAATVGFRAVPRSGRSCALDLKAGHVDAAVDIVPTDDPKLDSTLLFQEELVLACGSAGSRPASRKAGAEQRIVYAPPGVDTREFEAFVSPLAATPGGKTVVSSVTSMAILIHSTSLIAVLPGTLADALRRQLTLTIRKEKPRLKVPIHLWMRRPPDRDPSQTWLATQLARAARRLRRPSRHRHL